MPGKGMTSWHEWWLKMSVGFITSNQNRNDKVSSGGIQGHHHEKIQYHPHKCSKGYADILLSPRRPPSGRLPAVQDNSECPALLANLDHPSPSDQIKTPGKLTCGVILLHDNARPHTANTITALLLKFKWQVLGHPPYSPHLPPCNYAIFGPLKKAPRSK